MVTPVGCGSSFSRRSGCPVSPVAPVGPVSLESLVGLALLVHLLLLESLVYLALLVRPSDRLDKSPLYTLHSLGPSGPLLLFPLYPLNSSCSLCSSCSVIPCTPCIPCIPCGVGLLLLALLECLVSLRTSGPLLQLALEHLVFLAGPEVPLGLLDLLDISLLVSLGFQLNVWPSRIICHLADVDSLWCVLLFPCRSLDSLRTLWALNSLWAGWNICRLVGLESLGVISSGPVTP